MMTYPMELSGGTFFVFGTNPGVGMNGCQYVTEIKQNIDELGFQNRYCFNIPLSGRWFLFASFIIADVPEYHGS